MTIIFKIKPQSYLFLQMGVGFHHRGMAFAQVYHRFQRNHRADKLMIPVDAF